MTTALWRSSHCNGDTDCVQRPLLFPGLLVLVSCMVTSLYLYYRYQSLLKMLFYIYIYNTYLGEHYSKSSTYPINILNGACCFFFFFSGRFACRNQSIILIFFLCYEQIPLSLLNLVFTWRRVLWILKISFYP